MKLVLAEDDLINTCAVSYSGTQGNSYAANFFVGMANFQVHLRRVFRLCCRRESWAGWG